MVQKKIFQSIKEMLTEQGLDMFSADIRLAYFVYYMYMEDEDDIITISSLADKALSDSGLKVTKVAFIRSCYRSLAKIGLDSKDKIRALHILAQKVKL